MILVFITMGTASAGLFENLDRAVTEYNAYYEQLPLSLNLLLGNERILAGISMNDGSELNVWMTTKDGRVAEFEKVGRVKDYDPTIVIATDEDTVRNLITSTHPLTVYEEARSNGTLTINSLNFVSSAKFLVSDLAFKLLKTVGVF